MTGPEGILESSRLKVGFVTQQTSTKLSAVVKPPMSYEYPLAIIDDTKREKKVKKSAKKSKKGKKDEKGWNQD